MATIGQIADVVRNVAGDRVDLVGLMGPGIDPHLYRASEGDVVSLADADIVFYNGLHLEAKMADVFEKMSGSVTTVAVTDEIDRDELLNPPEFEGAYDPHVWFDVSKWMFGDRDDSRLAPPRVWTRCRTGESRGPPPGGPSLGG